MNKGQIRGKGKFNINGAITTGMIKLGFNTVPLLPDNGIRILNDGIITFNGKCNIGNASVISVATHGKMIFENNVSASSGLHIVCHNSIKFKENVLIGWNCHFMDSDLHKLKMTNGNHTRGYGNIEIGYNCWLANNCKVYKNVTIPNNCIIASDTIICSNVECEEFSLLGNDHSIKILKTGLFLDRNDDKILRQD